MNAGRVAGVFGLHGELKVAASRIGDDALGPGVELRARLADGSERTLRVRALRRHKGRPLVSFEGLDDPTAAQALTGAELSIDRAAVRLARGEYFDDDLVGCALVDRAGAVLGTVRAVEHYPAQDVLMVAPRQAQGDNAIVPLVRAFVKRIDVTAKTITVELPPGLLEPGLAEEA